MGIPYAEVIGDPIAHSKSPLIHKFWLGNSVSSATIAPGLPRRNCPVISPPSARSGLARLQRHHSPQGAGGGLLAEANEIVAGLGAMNHPGRRDGLFGTNLDALGAQSRVGEAFERPHSDRRRRRREGGLMGAPSPRVRPDHDHEPRLARAATLVEPFGGAVDIALLGGSPECTLLVNATPLGMKAHPALPIALDAMPPGATVIDIVYSPVETPLVADARARGHPGSTGCRCFSAGLAVVRHFFDEGISEAGTGSGAAVG